MHWSTKPLNYVYYSKEHEDQHHQLVNGQKNRLLTLIPRLVRLGPVGWLALSLWGKVGKHPLPNTHHCESAMV